MAVTEALRVLNADYPTSSSSPPFKQTSRTT